MFQNLYAIYSLSVALWTTINWKNGILFEPQPWYDAHYWSQTHKMFPKEITSTFTSIYSFFTIIGSDVKVSNVEKSCFP